MEQNPFWGQLPAEPREPPRELWGQVDRERYPATDYREEPAFRGDANRRAQTRGPGQGYQGSNWRPREERYGKGAAQNQGINQSRAPPRHMTAEFARITIEDSENSILRVDTRERSDPIQGRLIDPFACQHPSKVQMNYANNAARTGDGTRLAPRPKNGTYVTFTIFKTLEDYQLVIVGSIEYAASQACATYTNEIREGLGHRGFEPLGLPKPTPNSNKQAHLDFKVRYNGHPLLRVSCNGYQGPENMAIDAFEVNQPVVDELQPGQVETDKVQFLVVALSGGKVASKSCNLDGHIFSLGAEGAVYKTGMPRIRFELRRVLLGCPAAMGINADSVAIRYTDPVDNMELCCRQAIAPMEWVRLSNSAGGGVHEIAVAARQAGMRVEGPDQILSWAQLYEVHEPWIRLAGSSKIQPEHRTVANQYMTFAEDPSRTSTLWPQGEK